MTSSSGKWLTEPFRRLVPLLSLLTGLAWSGTAWCQSPEVILTQVGTPSWRPGDFQLFTAPASPYPDAFFGVIDTLLPLEGPSATVYTPHSPPYDMELSTGAANGGYVNKSVFARDDILQTPNAIYFALMLLPDPGTTGSSRDFASGPIISNSVFPISRNVDVWLDGVLVDKLSANDNVLNLRDGDVGFDGTSHRANVQVIWYPWDDEPTAGPLGSYELRQSYRDAQGNGWDISAPFQVVPEPAGTFLLLAGVIFAAMGEVRSRKTRLRNRR